jgi:multicomponent Na+:H+ antiporter subunit B
MRHHLVLRVVAKLLLPFILLFALYVQFHGDFGPGGGFQAGVIIAAGVILYAIIFGLDTARAVTPMAVIRALVAIGLIIYAGTGFAALVAGGNFLDYSALTHDPVEGQELGIMVIEFGVGTTVAAVMILIFYMFAGRGR